MNELGNKNDLRIAVVGLGQMGGGIARNLDRCGMLFGAFDLRPELFNSLKFLNPVANLPVSQLQEVADILLFAVPATSQIRSALGNGTGRAGQVIIDFTTSNPAHGIELASYLKTQDRHYLDAAMSGGAAGADCGELTLMIGGDKRVLEDCRSILEIVSSHIFHLGEVGSGHAMKLVHNMILHSSFLATCEGLQLAQRAGLDVKAAVDVLNAGNARSFVSEVRFPRDILSGSMNARSQVGNLEKDLGLAMQFGESLEARAPIGRLARDIFIQATNCGMADTDFSYLYPAYENIIDRLEAAQ